MDQKKSQDVGEETMILQEKEFIPGMDQKKSQDVGEETIILQEKECESIVELFKALTLSVNLCTMRQEPATFSNVSKKALIFTKRELSERHLAQMVYILPDFLKINKIMTHDKATCCMKPEMEIHLNLENISQHDNLADGWGSFVILHKLFAMRVKKYFEENPEKTEVPEGVLPQPFHQRRMLSLIDHNSSGRRRAICQPIIIPASVFKEPYPEVSIGRLLDNASCC